MWSYCEILAGDTDSRSGKAVGLIIGGRALRLACAGWRLAGKARILRSRHAGMGDMTQAASCTDRRVFVLEDDARIRQRLQRLLEAASGYAPGAMAESLMAADRLRDEARASDVLLIDLRLPDGSGSHFIAEAAAWQPRPRIAVFSVLGDEANVIAALEAGADGYLLKDLRDVDLVPMLDALMRGEAPMSPAIARHLLRRFRGEASPGAPQARLSERETEVLHLIAKGYSSSEIAQSLGVAASTVVTHVKHIYDKLNVHSRSQAVYEAAQQGLIRMGG